MSKIPSLNFDCDNFCQIAHRIRTGVQGLGEACIALIQSGGTVQSNPKDPFSKKELADDCKHVSEKVISSS